MMRSSGPIRPDRHPPATQALLLGRVRPQIARIPQSASRPITFGPTGSSAASPEQAINPTACPLRLHNIFLSSFPFLMYMNLHGVHFDSPVGISFRDKRPRELLIRFAKFCQSRWAQDTSRSQRGPGCTCIPNFGHLPWSPSARLCRFNSDCTERGPGKNDKTMLMGTARWVVLVRRSFGRVWGFRGFGIARPTRASVLAQSDRVHVSKLSSEYARLQAVGRYGSVAAQRTRDADRSRWMGHEP